MNIAQISKLGDRGASILASMLEVAPLFRFADFKLDASTHFVIADRDSFAGNPQRAEGAGLQRDAQVPNPTARNLALYGREISIDDVRKADANVGVSHAGLRLFADRRLKGLGGRLAAEVQNEMLIAPDAANRMLGLSTFVLDGPAGVQVARLGFTQAELAAMNVQVSLQINTTANENLLVEAIERELALVPGANAILVNNLMGARLSTIARRLGAAGETIDSFGQKVQTFDNVPLVRLPTTAIPQTEPDGVNNDNTSIYIVRFAEDLGVSFSTNSGFLFTDFPEDVAAPDSVARLQFFLNLTVERQDALRRLSRIRF